MDYLYFLCCETKQILIVESMKEFAYLSVQLDNG